MRRQDRKIQIQPRYLNLGLWQRQLLQYLFHSWAPLNVIRPISSHCHVKSRAQSLREVLAAYWNFRTHEHASHNAAQFSSFSLKVLLFRAGAAEPASTCLFKMLLVLLVTFARFSLPRPESQTSSPASSFWGSSETCATGCLCGSLSRAG